MTLPAALPPVIPEPFAQNADPANINTIPATTGTPGLASYNLGFPPDTMQPIVAGGIPPEGQDFNGILFAITSQLYYLQSGQRWPFNSAVATAIGGYPVGAIIAMADGAGEWINNSANNMGNPDTAGPGSTAGWAVLASYGSTPVTGLTGAAVVTLTGNQAKSPVLVFSGTLTGNQLVQLPSIPFEWILVNLCTGSFTLTANAGGGVSVTVPQGGYGSPLGVYSIGDGNLYPSVSPLGVPISIAPSPLTLVERDNNSNVFAQYYNSASATDNPSIVGVFTDAGDGGWLRKNSLANFESQLLLQSIGGAVTAGQVPVGAVTQYTPQILASANLTGTPVAPTQPVGTANTTVATTAFVNRGSSLGGADGYRLNPDGTIDQWGQVASNANAGNTVVNFNIPFPTACRNVEVTIIAPGGLGGAGSYQAFLLAAPGTGSFTWRSISNAAPATVIMWRAIGS